MTWRAVVTALMISAAAALAGTLGDTVFVPGQTYYGRNQYIEYYAGNLPYILSAPHGGSLEPAEIPDRTSGTTTTDLGTQEVARLFISATVERTGKHPHVIICRLSRKKLDANRDSVEGAEGNLYALQAWQEYHAFLDSACKAVTAMYGKGFYVDLHGHGHTIQRLELGYLLSASALGLSDNTLDSSPGYTNSSSVRSLATSSSERLSAILRGPQSLGTYFENHGLPAVPSTMQPKPGSDPYFTGGYDTERHGSLRGGTIDAVQIESNHTGVRDTDGNRRRYAAAIAEVLDSYTQVHYLGTQVEPPHLVINEVLFDIPRDDTATVDLEGDANGDGVRSVRGDEFVEIVNTGSTPATLDGYRVLERDMQPVFTFPENTTLEAGQYAVVFGGVGPGGFGTSLPTTAKFFAAKPGKADSGFYVSSNKTNLLGAGDNVVLIDPVTNEVFDEVCWGSSTPKTAHGKKLIGPNTVNGDSIAGAIAQSVTRSPDITGPWTTHLSLALGSVVYSPGRSAVTPLAVYQTSELPRSTYLEQNFPNPFNPTTSISFHLPMTGEVKLAIYDLLGREVAVLVNEKKSLGDYSITFDASGLSSGVYLYRLQTGSVIDTKKLTVLR